MAKKTKKAAISVKVVEGEIILTCSAPFSPELIEGTNKAGKAYRVVELFNLSDGWGGVPVKVEGLDYSALADLNKVTEAITPEVTAQVKLTASLDKLSKASKAAARKKVKI